MNLSKLETLKDKLVHGKEFADIFEYFLDHFGENSEFLKLGQRDNCPELERLISEVGQQMIGQEAQLRGFLLTHLAEHGFYHGAGFLNGFISTVFYFESIHQGLMAVALSEKGTKFARFRGMPMPTSWKPSSN